MGLGLNGLRPSLRLQVHLLNVKQAIVFAKAARLYEP